MNYRKIRKQKLLIMGMVVLSLGVSCSDTGQEEWGAVSGLSPADGASTTDTTPDLSWTEVPDAKGYEVRIADSEAELDQDTPRPVTGSSYTPTVALTNNQTHYWKVRAKDAGEQYGPWSVVQSLKIEWGVVSGLSPADGASTTDTTPAFSWAAVPDAAGYELQMADSPAGLESSSIQSVTDTSYTPASVLTNEQTRYWRVRAVDGDDQRGAWSEVHSLAVSIGAVSDLSPANGASTTDTTPTFSWDAVPGAAGYELQLADSLAGLESSNIQSVTDTLYTPASVLTNEQTRYWRVRAVDEDDQKGAWSEVHSLAVSIGAVSGLSPANGASTTDTTPTFSWDAVPGAAGYELQLADSLTGVEAAPTQSVTDSSYTPSSALADKQIHYWRVQAKDGAGQYGAWSVVAAIQIGFSIGDTGPAGGIVFYDKGSYSDGWRYLEVAPSDQGKIEWGGFGTLLGGTSTDIGSGKSNTEKIVNQLGPGNYAARLCYNFELGSYDDWFLPSDEELNELYKQKNTVGGFVSDYYYWSSSEYDSDYAWGRDFNGYRYGSYKSFIRYVRATRAF